MSSLAQPVSKFGVRLGVGILKNLDDFLKSSSNVRNNVRNISTGIRTGRTTVGEGSSSLASALNQMGRRTSAQDALRIRDQYRQGLITQREASENLISLGNMASRTSSADVLKSLISRGVATGAPRVATQPYVSPIARIVSQSRTARNVSEAASRGAGGTLPKMPKAQSPEAMWLSRAQEFSKARTAAPETLSGASKAADAAKSAKTSWRDGLGRKFLRGTAETVGIAGPVFIDDFEEATGIDIPQPVEMALYGLSAGLGGRQALRSLSAVRQPGTSIGKRLFQSAMGAGAGYGVFESGKKFLQAVGGDSNAGAEEAPPDVFKIPEEGIVGDQTPIPPEQADEQAQTQLEAIDAAFQEAVDQLTESYGGVEEMLRALETGDPQLAATLASLDAQYQQAQTAVAAEYSAAIGDIAGYQQQVDQLMQEVAAQQAADFEAAAGGLEGIDVGVDPTTAGLADMAGVSDTAVGGGAITGAGLARGLAGAASAAGAASRMRVGGELAGLVGSTRADAAAQAAALQQNYLGQRYQAEVDAAMAEAARRQAIEDALVQNELALGEGLAQLQAQRAQQLGQISPRDYATASGAAARPQSVPRWYGAQLGGDFDQIVEGLDLIDPDTQTPLPVTVGTVQTTLDQLYAASSLARESFNAGSPAEAYATLSNFYAQLEDANTWLDKLGIPSNAYDAYIDLFGSAPY